MYQVQVKINGDWQAVGPPTVSYRQAADDAADRAVWQRVETRVVCTDSAAGPQ